MGREGRAMAQPHTEMHLFKFIEYKLLKTHYE